MIMGRKAQLFGGKLIIIDNNDKVPGPFPEKITMERISDCFRLGAPLLTGIS